jgi:hypothetical protein
MVMVSLLSKNWPALSSRRGPARPIFPDHMTGAPMAKITNVAAIAAGLFFALVLIGALAFHIWALTQIS